MVDFCTDGVYELSKNDDKDPELHKLFKDFNVWDFYEDFEQ